MDVPTDSSVDALVRDSSFNNSNGATSLPPPKAERCISPSLLSISSSDSDVDASPSTSKGRNRSFKNEKEVCYSHVVMLPVLLTLACYYIE